MLYEFISHPCAKTKMHMKFKALVRPGAYDELNDPLMHHTSYGLVSLSQRLSGSNISFLSWHTNKLLDIEQAIRHQASILLQVSLT